MPGWMALLACVQVAVAQTPGVLMDEWQRLSVYDNEPKGKCRPFVCIDVRGRDSDWLIITSRGASRSGETVRISIQEGLQSWTGGKHAYVNNTERPITIPRASLRRLTAGEQTYPGWIRPHLSSQGLLDLIEQRRRRAAS